MDAASGLEIAYAWRGQVTSAELNELHAAVFGHQPFSTSDWDWARQLRRHSLGWATARDGRRLVGFVNVIWDGSVHAFIEDTMVSGDTRRRGIGTRLVALAQDHARAAGCEWLHVDFEDHLRGFYFGACGFRPTNGGLIEL